MGRSPCCSKEGIKKGAWSALEDEKLTKYIQAHGEGQWRSLPMRAGLKRCGKSCRLRWKNYLSPDIILGNISPDEEDLIIRLHNLLGNRWSLIAGRLPGRTDNEIKNYWNRTVAKRAKAQVSSSDETIFQKEKSSSETPPSNSTHEMLPSESGADEPSDSPQATKAKNEVIRPRATRFRSSTVMAPVQPPAAQDIDELGDDQLYSINNQEMDNNATVETHSGNQKFDSLYDYDSDLLNFEIDEALLKNWTTSPCLPDDAVIDLDSLAFFLNNDE